MSRCRTVTLRHIVEPPHCDGSTILRLFPIRHIIFNITNCGIHFRFISNNTVIKSRLPIKWDFILASETSNCIFESGNDMRKPTTSVCNILHNSIFRRIDLFYHTATTFDNDNHVYVVGHNYKHRDKNISVNSFNQRHTFTCKLPNTRQYHLPLDNLSKEMFSSFSTNSNEECSHIIIVPLGTDCGNSIFPSKSSH